MGRVPACCLAAALLVPAPLPGQSRIVDEGEFRLTLHGSPAGSETFSIRRAGGGPDARTIAQGRITLDRPAGRRRVVVALEARGPGLAPVAYQAKVSGDRRVEIAGRISGGRFSAKILSDRGEEVREFRAGPGTLILEDGVAHHYAFLARRAGEGVAAVPVLVPIRGDRVTVRLVPEGEDSLRIGGRALPARRIRVEAGAGDVRTIWVDGHGRLLRVEVPARGYVAERTSAPSP